MNQVLLVEPETRAPWETELIALASQADELTPEMVVEAASKPTSPLHGMLCWDDTRAAHEFRLFQARSLIRRVVVYSIDPHEDVNKTRNFVNVVVRDADGERRTYMPLTSVVQSQDYTDQMLDDAKRALISFKRKYAVLSGLVKVFASIDELVGVDVANG